MAGGRVGEGRRRVAEGLLVASILGAPLAIGGVHAGTRGVLAIAAALALAIMLGDRRASGGRIAITVPAVALALALAATLAQLVPLPPRVLAILSPGAAETFTATLGAFGWRAVTLDVAATVAEAGKLALYGAFLLATTLYASRAHRRRRLLLAVIAAAVACALLGFLQALAGSTKVFFLYSPENQILNEILVRGTFVNPNHFGALLALAAPLALVWGLREPARRWLAFGAVVLLNVGVVLSMSRGALVGALVGQGLAFALDHRLRARTSRDPWLAASLVGVAVAAAAGVGALVGVRSLLDGSHPGMGSLADTSGKTYIWRHALTLAWEHPWTGVGRGAFEQAFTRVTTAGGSMRHQWAENGYLEAMVSWGVPFAVLLGLLGLLAFRLCVERLDRDPFAVGALGALVGLAVHEVADFAIELPGVALPALAVVATLFGSRTSEDLPAQKRVRVRWPWMLAPIAPIALVALAGAFPSASREVTRLAELGRDPATPIDRYVAEAHAARARHPADFRLAAVVAMRLADARHPATLRWLNDAMFLNPSHPATHLLAAELLASTGRRDQALVEYRAAAVAAPGSAVTWVHAAKRFPAIADLLRAVPGDLEAHLTLATWLWTQARWSDAALVLARARTLAPDDLRPLRLQVEVALRGNSPEAARLAAELVARVPGEEAHLLLAEAELAQGAREKTAKMLDLLVNRTQQQLDLELRLAAAMAAAGELDPARKRLDGLDWPLAKGDRARVHEARATVERLAGNEHQVRWELEQATRLRGN